MKSAAIITINYAQDMTRRDRLSIAFWMVRSAWFLVRYGHNLSNVFRARYLYPD